LRTPLRGSRTPAGPVTDTSADLPGVDPDKDVELTVSHEMLHIEAGRRQEGRVEELRCGSLFRSLPLPEGVMEADITATYKAGVLETHIPEPKREPVKKA